MRTRVPSLLRRRWRVGLFVTLYLYQGLVAGFATIALANHFAAAGSDAGTVGRHLAMVGLPWVLQPLLWGPLLDRTPPHRLGSRRVWLLRALLGAQASLCGLLLTGPLDIVPVGAILFLHSLCASLADTATDRMLIRSVPEMELGRTCAATRIGFAAGSALGAAVLAWSLALAGLHVSVLTLLALTTTLAMAAAVVRERPEDAFLPVLGQNGLDASAPAADAPPAMAAFLGRLAAAFRSREAAALLAACFAIDFAVALFQTPFGVAMVRDHGWEAAALSRFQALLGLVAGTVGALAVGVFVDRAGPARGLAWLFLACAAAFAVIAALIAAGLAGRTGPFILGLSGIVPALLYVALLPTLVLASRARDASATQFQIYMAALNLGDVSGAALAGAAERGLDPVWSASGTAMVFVVCAAFRFRLRTA